MSLQELSADYRYAAELLRQRMRRLRQAIAETNDPEELWQLRHRIAVLTPMLTEMNDLAELTERYYERGYWRNEKYTL